MPSVTIREVAVSGDSITLQIDSDLLIGPTGNQKAIPFTVYVSRAEYGSWVQDNAGKTIDDLILQKIQAQYNLIVKLAAKAQTYVNKTVTW